MHDDLTLRKCVGDLQIRSAK